MDELSHPDQLRDWHGLLKGVGRCPWFWCALVASLVTSPALFLTSLVLGVVAMLVGFAFWSARGRLVVVAVGAGLVLGSVPYAVAALKVVLGG